MTNWKVTTEGMTRVVIVRSGVESDCFHFGFCARGEAPRLGVMRLNPLLQSRRQFCRKLMELGVTVTALPSLQRLRAEAAAHGAGEPGSRALTFPGPWQFWIPKSSIILVSDQQLRDLQDPDREVDLSLSSTPNVTTLRKLGEQARAQGVRTIILAFDEFWSQYRAGQGGKPRELLPDTEDYIRCVAQVSQTLKAYGLGLELSLLSPLEIGRGYARQTGETGQWVQYREGYRDPKSGRYHLALWEQRRWTNNKGAFELKRAGVRVFAFRERRVGGTAYYVVDPAELVELAAPEVEVDESTAGSTGARRLILSGRGDSEAEARDRVLAIVRYSTPELDYFSPQAIPFLTSLVDAYHAAEIPLHGLYADEMHIQQDWGYNAHHDEGQFTFRYLTPHLARQFAARYGEEYADFEKYLVYFCYGQHGFMPNLEARLPAQHVFGAGAAEVQKTFLLRRRYYDLLEQTVVGLFTAAKRHAEERYGRELESRAHATWAQSPTCDIRFTGTEPTPPRQYEYTPDFLWSNTVQQAASACSDYFAWNDFLTGGGNDHAEGGWSDRNYYGIALACSTGILNRTPYAYAAAWGMPQAALAQRQAVCDAFGASAHPWFQAVQDCQHRDIEVLMLYPLSLVACEERFGSWMTQYGYANYVTPQKLLDHARVQPDGCLEMAGRRFSTLVVLFEPLPPAGLVPMLRKFAEAGGKVIWSGPPPRFDLSGAPVLEEWQQLFSVQSLQFGVEGGSGAGGTVRFASTLGLVPAQPIVTDFLVDRIYPVVGVETAETVARHGRRVLGLHRRVGANGTATYLGFRPRDDQAASLGEESRTWFEILRILGAYGERKDDHPAVVARTSRYVSCRFPNGTTTVAAHYRSHVESWPGGFHRDAQQDDEILKANPLPDASLTLRDFRVNGFTLEYDGRLCMAFRVGADGRLLAFAGHACQNLGVGDRVTRFASKKVDVAAWAPVLPERQIPGGAVMEIWVDGDAEMTLPLPAGLEQVKLFFQGAKVDELGEALPCRCEGGNVRFAAVKSWPQKHLFAVRA